MRSTEHKVPFCVVFSTSSVTSSILAPNLLLNTLFSNTLSLRSWVNVSDHVSHPYQTTDKILFMSIFIFLDRKLAEKRICVKWQQKFLPSPFTACYITFHSNCVTYTLYQQINPLNAELNPFCHLLALLGGANIVVISRLRVNLNLSPSQSCSYFVEWRSSATDSQTLYFALYRRGSSPAVTTEHKDGWRIKMDWTFWRKGKLLFSDICVSVHHIWNCREIPTWCNNLFIIINNSTCFGHLYVNLQ